jgi:hypothetical protein
LTPLALDPFCSVKLLSLPSKHKEVTFFYVKKTFLQNKGKAKKNEALKWKKNNSIALKTLFQGNLQGKLVVFFSKIVMLHHMGTSLEKFNIKLRVHFYNLSKKIFKTTTK